MVLTVRSAWIGSLQYFLIYFPAVFIGRMVDTSSHYILFYIAAVLYPVSLFLTAQVKTYWQTVLSHGVLFGIAVGVLFCPAIAVVQHWCKYSRIPFTLYRVSLSAMRTVTVSWGWAGQSPS